eukprot:6196829-Pleurochrysis_carterae.AAC.5
MARAFDQLDEKLTRSAVSSPGSEQLERLAFNFGELDITVTHHKRLGRAVRLNESNWRPPQTYSLRPDRLAFARRASVPHAHAYTTYIEEDASH